MTKLVEKLKGVARKAVDFVERNSKKVVAAGVGMAAAAFGGTAHAQTDATSVVTSVMTGFAAVAAATLTIVTFYVVLKLVKRTVK